MGGLEYYSILISYVYNRMINTSDMFLGVCNPILQPLNDVCTPAPAWGLGDETVFYEKNM